jgi:hypothetical protein
VSRSKPGSETSNLPFELMVRADGREQTTLNVGVDVPVPAGPGSFSYRRVGNNLACGSATYGNGTVSLSLNIEDSSIHGDTAVAGAPAINPSSSVSAALPIFRSFQTSTRLSMREGETVQFTLATDKQTGETLKVSVTASRVR